MCQVCETIKQNVCNGCGQSEGKTHYGWCLVAYGFRGDE